MKKIFFIGGGIILFLVLFGLFQRFFDTPLPQKVLLREKTYTLEVADTRKKQSQGLGERDSLCESCAMLFVFEKPDKQIFWMKGMRFPIDIAWLYDGRVVFIEHRVATESTEVYQPEVVANQVLEFNAGVLDDIYVGEEVTFSF